MSPEIIVSNACFTISNAKIYTFGILTSSVHMAWLRKICGYYGSSYRYSNTLVYNNFVWCQPSELQRKKIEQTAQNILDVRKKYMFRAEGKGKREEISEKNSNPSSLVPISSLADLYDPILMPKDLRDAHRKNDSAVLEAYGFDKNFSENEIVAELMKLYKNLTEK